jgi:ABC-2 type transport system permease protein
MVLSGIFFSYHNFPEWTIPIINKLPLTILVDSLRGVFLEGAGLREIYLTFLILCSTGLVFGGIGMKIYKWH